MTLLLAFNKVKTKMLTGPLTCDFVARIQQNQIFLRGGHLKFEHVQRQHVYLRC